MKGHSSCKVCSGKSFQHVKKYKEVDINVGMGICAGKPVEEEPRLEKQLVFKNQGELVLKGFDRPLRTYEVEW